jgi:dynein heavy chain 1
VYRFYVREVRIGSRTLSTVRRNLAEVIAVCNGSEKPTQQLREIMAGLKSGAVPPEWRRAYVSAPSLTAGKWIGDFKRRIEQLASVVRDGVTKLSSTGVWLGGLFSPEAYVMALRQVVASRNAWSLEEVALEVHMDVGAERLAALRDGCVVHGMALEGAAWDCVRQELQLSSSIAHRLRNATLCWVKKASLEERTRISMPVYLNRNRSDMIFTVDVAAPLADVPSSVWSQRGLALIAWSQSI